MLLLLLLLVLLAAATGGTHAAGGASLPPLLWEDMASLSPPTAASTPPRNATVASLLQQYGACAGGGARRFASEVLGGQPVYVSLTTIHSRIYGVAATLTSIVTGTVVPDHVYVFVSRDPHLLDQGVTEEYVLRESKGALQRVARAYPHLSVVFTDNLGPHRKLLPLLARKWGEDCAIATVDDHEVYRPTMLAGLLAYYEASARSAVVALRARRVGLCRGGGAEGAWRVAPYTKNGKGQVRACTCTCTCTCVRATGPPSPVVLCPPFLCVSGRRRPLGCASCCCCPRAPAACCTGRASCTRSSSSTVASSTSRAQARTPHTTQHHTPPPTHVASHP